MSSSPREIVAPPQKDPTIMNPAASADHKAERYYGAARLCNAGSTVKFQDGSVWDEKQLYARAIELNPSFAAAYHNLALTLGEEESISISGTDWNRRHLYIKAIEHEPSFAPAYVNLSGLMGPEDTVTVGVGPSLDRCALLLQAIQVDPRCAMAYMNLGICLPPQSMVKLPHGAMLSPTALMATARQLDPSMVPMPMPSADAVTPHRAIQSGTPATPTSVIMTPQKLAMPGSPIGLGKVVMPSSPVGLGSGCCLLGSSGAVTATLKSPPQSASLGLGSASAQP